MLLETLPFVRFRFSVPLFVSPFSVMPLAFEFGFYFGGFLLITRLGLGWVFSFPVPFGVGVGVSLGVRGLLFSFRVTLISVLLFFSTFVLLLYFVFLFII